MGNQQCSCFTGILAQNARSADAGICAPNSISNTAGEDNREIVRRCDAIDISGCWRLKDSDGGLEFWYQWEHNLESGTFEGEQSGYGPISNGHIKGNLIEWEVADEASCSGTLVVHEGKPSIVDGVYGKEETVFGSFTGERREFESFFVKTTRPDIAPLTPTQTGVEDLKRKRDILIEQRRAVTPEFSREIPVVRSRMLECLGLVGQLPGLTHLKIHYEDEFGLDEGGVRRDWFDSMGKAFHKAAIKGDWQLALAADESIFPRPVGPNFVPRFADLVVIGRMCGLAVWFDDPLPMPVNSILCKFLLGAPVRCADLQQLDPLFYEHRVELLLKPGGVSEMEELIGSHLYFVSVASELQPVVVELGVGGAERRVTEENKRDYIQLLCDYYLCGGMSEQINCVLEGFHDIFPEDQLTYAGINHCELALLITGYPELDPKSWQIHAQTQGSTHVLTLFWEVVDSMSADQRAKLLHFVTGSSRLPPGGFAALDGIQHPKFQVHVTDSADTSNLPYARTCNNLLVISCYGSKEVLSTKLLQAIDEFGHGFGFA